MTTLNFLIFFLSTATSAFLILRTTRLNSSSPLAAVRCSKLFLARKEKRRLQPLPSRGWGRSPLVEPLPLIDGLRHRAVLRCVWPPFSDTRAPASPSPPSSVESAAAEFMIREIERELSDLSSQQEKTQLVKVPTNTATVTAAGTTPGV